MDRPAQSDRPAHYRVRVASPVGGFCAHEHSDQVEALACALKTFCGLPWRVVRVEDTGLAAETTPEAADETAFAQLVRDVRQRVKTS